jgi:hypothetical protein
MNATDSDGSTRRDLLKLGLASSAAAAISAAPLVATSAEKEARANESAPRRPGELPRPRFLVDVHVHVGGAPEVAALAASMKGPKDWVVYRSKDPALFAKMVSLPQEDNSDVLIKKMDENGITQAIIQTVPGKNASNRRVADIARRHEGRLFPLYRPEGLMGALGSGTLPEEQASDFFASNARSIANEIDSLFPELGFIGVGEVVPGGMVTSAIDPVKIAQDMGPIMEALKPKQLPIQIPTGSSAWRGGLYYLWEPLWVDELAGNFPDIPIVLTKMGRSFRTSFDACTVVAMRNANVYFDLTDSHPEHVREAADKIGADRIMFGTDLSGISVNYAYEMGFNLVEGANLSPQEWESVAWRTASNVYSLGLGAEIEG